ncbi:MAG: hypothetical protein ACERKN_08535 [Velocimicrobium sp.]
MLNEKKIRVMAKLSMMEKNKEQFEIKDYYMGDYVRTHLLKTIIRITIGYAFVLMLAAIYNAEQLINSAVTLDYMRIGFYALVIYIVLILVYAIGSFMRYLYKYKRAQRYIIRYEKGLGILRRFYQNDSEHK